MSPPIAKPRTLAASGNEHQTKKKLLRLFKNNKRSKTDGLIKRVTVYISDKFNHLIIARIHQNDSGILYEQNTCFSSDYPIDLTIFGKEIINSLNLYSFKDANLRDRKLSDWTAYNHSKCKSGVSFENDYIQISIRGANTSNLVLIIEGRPHKNSALTINSSISFYADAQELGNRIKEIYEACLTGKVF